MTVSTSRLLETVSIRQLQQPMALSSKIDNFMPGIYTVIEQAYDKYEPQETHSVNEVWIIRKQNKELYGFLTV